MARKLTVKQKKFADEYIISGNATLAAEKTVNAIDKSLNLLGAKHKELFELKYINGLPLNEVYLEMNISKRSYYRIRRELVTVVGQQLGLINVV